MRGTAQSAGWLVLGGLMWAGLAAQAPAGATAKCKDGSYSTATTTKGMCSNHGGVAEKLAKAKAAKPKPAAAPVAAAGGPPATATAKCKDGTYSTAKSTKGACSKHGGVAEAMVGTAAAPTPATSTAPAAEAGAPVATAERPAAAPATATAKCKDGTYSESKQHSGACSHHGGVAEWYK
jgi:hypothetical protein